MGVLADRYALAFLEAGGEAEQLTQAVRTLEAYPALRDALVSPAVSAEEKERVLSRVAALFPAPSVRRFLGLLVRKGRVALIAEAERSCRRLALERSGGAVGVLTSARPMDDGECSALAAALCRRQGLRQVSLETRVDPGLLGGFRLEIQGITYDKSVRGSLDALARDLRKRGAASV